jgi:hypothetical protein
MRVDYKKVLAVVFQFYQLNFQFNQLDLTTFGKNFEILLENLTKL